MRKKRKKILSPYINCSVKGAISLFMAVLMTPFLSVALVLMDAGRYNSAVSILDEAMGVSATSTLAETDSYLHERWGLLGIDQKENIKDSYGYYLETNAGIMRNSLELGTVDAKGMYELADNQVLYNQILEYCKLNAPTKLAVDFLNISDLIAQLEKIGNIGTIFSAMSGGINALDSTITMVQSSEELKTTARQMETQIADYETAYSSFENAVEELIRALNEPEPDPADYKDKDGNEDSGAYQNAVAEWKQAIENARVNANEARDSYAETIGELKESMDTYKTKMGECLSAFQGITKNLGQMAVSVADYERKTSNSKKELDKYKSLVAAMEKDPNFDPENETYQDMQSWVQTLSEEVAEQNVEYEVMKAGQKGLEVVQSGFSQHFSQYSEAVFEKYMSDLETLKAATEAFDAEGFTADSGPLSADNYHSVSVTDYVRADEIDAYLAEQKEELLGGSLKDLLNGLVSFFNSLVKVSLLYDPDLCSAIDMNYYNTKLGGLPGDDCSEGSAMAIVNDIGTIINTVNDFSSHLRGLKLLTALKDLKALLESIVQLGKDIVEFGKAILYNILDLLTGYDRLYYSTYSAFNLPCRTDNGPSGLSFSGITGYNLSNTSLPQHGSAASTSESFSDAVQKLQDYSDAAGGDLTFSGAELEYILYGSENEVANQIYTFFVLYLLRLLLDIVPVAGNAEVQSLAAASTFGYPVVLGLIMFIEPLADTLLLVNGGNVELIKTSIYLTPSGLPGLLENLVKIVKLTPADKEALKGDLAGAFGATDDDYDYQKTLNDYEASKKASADTGSGVKLSGGVAKYLKNLQSFSYREYCFFLILLTVTEEQQFSRLKNLIQMETLYHYQQENGEDYIFDLRKSYTYLDTEVTASVKQMMPSLIDSSLLTITRKQYRGY